MRSHDQQVMQLYREIKEKVLDANSHQQIYDAVEMAINFVAERGKPVKFDHFFLKTLITLSTIALIAAIVLAMVNPITVTWFTGIVCVCLFVIIAVCLYFIDYKNKLLLELNRRIILRDAILDNDIYPDPVFHGLARQHYSKFKEFVRGNYSRRILAEYKSSSASELNFTYYQFEYVDEEEMLGPGMSSKGQLTVRSRTIYKHRYRSGFMMAFPYVTDIGVFHVNGDLSDNGVDYEAASIEFSSRFKLSSNNRQQLVKFLTPQVVELFVNFAKTGVIFNLEISYDGIMCISFPDDHYLPVTKTGMRLVRETAGDKEYGLDAPELFLLMLKDHTTINTLHNAIYFMTRLIELTKPNLI